MSTIMPQLLQEYQPDNVYNANETGFFHSVYVPASNYVEIDEST